MNAGTSRGKGAWPVPVTFLILTAAFMFLPMAGLAQRHSGETITKAPEPLLIMYGYDDRSDFLTGDVWPDKATWDARWGDVFSSFTIVTGRTSSAQLVQNLRAKGVLFAYHVPNTVDTAQGANRKQKAESLLSQWAAPFENNLGGQLPGGFDAISIDELRANPDGSEQAAIVSETLYELHRRYPDKTVIAWGVYQLGLSGSWGLLGFSQTVRTHYDEQLKALEETSGTFIVESYVTESNPQRLLFQEMGRNLSRRFPKLYARTVFGLAISQTAPYAFDDRPGMDFPGFIEQQLNLIRQDPLLSRTNGAAFWAFYRALPATISRLSAYCQKWLVQRETKPAPAGTP